MKSAALTLKQQELATKNHKLIYKYANSNNINVDEFYDVLAIGLCRAARAFDESLGYKFSTLAYRCMDSEYKYYWHQKLSSTQIPDTSIVSYNSQVNDDTSMCQLIDLISNSKSHQYKLDIGRVEVEEFINMLSPVQRFVLIDLINGYKKTEIAKKIGCTSSNVCLITDSIKKKWQRYAAK